MAVEKEKKKNKVTKTTKPKTKQNQRLFPFLFLKPERYVFIWKAFLNDEIQVPLLE